MKRSFLNGLATCFVLGFLAGLVLILTGNLAAGAAVSLACMMIAALLLRAADRARETKFKPLRVLGWLAGVGAVLGLLVIIAAL